jgi:hypothetical protein
MTHGRSSDHHQDQEHDGNACAILDGLDRLTSVNEQVVNDHEGRLRLGSRARGVVGLEREEERLRCVGQRFRNIPGFHDLVRRRAPEGSYFSDGDRVWFVQPPRRFRLDRCQTRRCDFAPGRLSGDGPCGRLAGLPDHLACLLAGPSGGGRHAQPPRQYRRPLRSGPPVWAQPHQGGPYVVLQGACQISPSVAAGCSVPSSAASSCSSASMAASSA